MKASGEAHVNTLCRSVVRSTEPNKLRLVGPEATGGEELVDQLAEDAGLGGQVEDGVAAPDHPRSNVGGPERRSRQAQLRRSGRAAGGGQQLPQPSGRDELRSEPVSFSLAEFEPDPDAYNARLLEVLG